MATIIKNKKIYWALIITFVLLYTAVAFVSTLHAITFFQLANITGLAILLGAAYEVGQATVLFSILTTHNGKKGLAWAMMFLLTALQITANVYASFKFMDKSGSMDWQYWQKAILIGVQAKDPMTYKIIISWISGALLPIVALGMTALIAENIRLANGGDLDDEEDEDDENENDELNKTSEISKDQIEEIIENEVRKRLEEERNKDVIDPDRLKKEYDSYNNVNSIDNIKVKSVSEEVIPPIVLDLQKFPSKEEDYYLTPKINKNLPQNQENELFELETSSENKEELSEDLSIKDEEAAYVKRAKENLPAFVKKTKEIFKDPSNKIRGWHLMNEYVDDEFNVFQKGRFIENNKEKIPTSKKA